MSSRFTADQLIERLNLSPLAGEGGYYRQTYVVHNESGQPLTTAILFLVTDATWSGLHRLGGDELFHAYSGDSCQMVVVHPDSTLDHHRLGSDFAAGDEVQVLVPGGTWQGTKLIPGGAFGYALLGTTMTPGFRTDQFELGTVDDLESMSEELRKILLPFLSPDTPR